VSIARLPYLGAFVSVWPPLSASASRSALPVRSRPSAAAESLSGRPFKKQEGIGRIA
jgi:hypothetical protein